MKTAVSEAQVATQPSGDLRADVQELFESVARMRMPSGDGFRTATTRRPSANVALAALGFADSSYSGWKNGNPRRVGTFTQHLLDGLDGEFDWVPSNKDVVVQVWARFRQDDSNADLISRLRAGLENHCRILIAAKLAPRRSGLPAANGGEDETPLPSPDAGSRWSDAWTSRVIEPWARGLLERRDRVVYLYGARSAGKSVLMTALGARLAAKGGTARIHVNLRDVVRRFRVTRDAAALRIEIFEEIARQIAAEVPAGVLRERFNFDDEMVHLLARAPAGPIYLFIENADHCLRIPDPDLRRDSIAATAPLFNFLRPVAQESGMPVLDRISVVLEGSRPLGDLAEAYPASPLNDGRPYILRRFTKAECAELGGLAGLTDEADIHRLYEETGGHRSLVWAVLRSAGDEPGPGLPVDLAGLDPVGKVAEKLADELGLQGLGEAFAGVRAGTRIDFESRTRLRDCMYVDASDPPACGAPLLEAALVRAKSE